MLKNNDLSMQMKIVHTYVQLYTKKNRETSTTFLVFRMLMPQLLHRLTLVKVVLFPHKV